MPVGWGGEGVEGRVEEGGGLGVEVPGQVAAALPVRAAVEHPGGGLGLLAFQLFAEQAVGLLRGNHVKDAPAEAGQLARVEVGGQLQQVGLGVGAGDLTHAGRQGIAGADDDPGLLRGDPAGAQRGGGRAVAAGQGAGSRRSALAGPGAIRSTPRAHAAVDGAPVSSATPAVSAWA